MRGQLFGAFVTCLAAAAVVLPRDVRAAPPAPPAPREEPGERRVDVCVYGGTAAGVVAAVAAKQRGKTVLLIEPGRHLGGMSSGGLGWTDFGNKAAIGGLSLDFYRRVGKVHGKAEPSWTFEPSAAERVFNDFVYEIGLPVVFEHRVTTVRKDGARITRVAFVHAPPQPSGAPAPTAVTGSKSQVV